MLVPAVVDLARLRVERPELILETLAGGRLVDLKRGEADLAIRIGPITDEELVARSLGEVAWSLYASKAYMARVAPSQSTPMTLPATISSPTVATWLRCRRRDG